MEALGVSARHRLAWRACVLGSRSEGGSPVTEKFRITYATMSADNEELQAAYDAAA